MKAANLSQANLSQAELFEADLNQADLEAADLSGADLAIANLNQANLNQAALERANERGANLKNANLDGTNLEGGDSSESNLNSTKKPPFKTEKRLFGLIIILALSYCPRQQPAKYLRRSNVSPPSSGWSRCGAIAPKAPGNN